MAACLAWQYERYAQVGYGCYAPVQYEAMRMELSDDDDLFFVFVFVTYDHGQQLLTLSQ